MSTNSHLLGDYALGVLLVAAGAVTPLAGTGAGVALLVLGIAELALASMTRWKWAVVASVPVRTHAALDVAIGIASLGAGAALWLARSDARWLWVAGVGVAVLLMTGLTRWSATQADGSHAKDPDYVQDAEGVLAGRYGTTVGSHSSESREPESPESHEDSESPSEWPDPARPDEPDPRRSRSA